MKTAELELKLEIAAIEGYLMALYDFAWWKNGESYVGCGVKTYGEAAMPLRVKLHNLNEKLKEMKGLNNG